MNLIFSMSWYIRYKYVELKMTLNATSESVWVIIIQKTAVIKKKKNYSLR